MAPISVVTQIGEFELLKGALLIGRLPECTVCLTDPLVSRMHARIIVQGNCVVVEDLHSANGVYLNGVRVVTTAVLREGDRLLMGTTEFSLFELRDSLMRVRAAQPHEPDTERVSPRPSGPKASPASKPEQPRPLKPSVAAFRPAAPSLAPQPLPASFDRVPATARATALKMIGALADRLAAEGELEEAVYVVSGQLRRILQGANGGLAVPPDVAELASHYALAVGRWSGQPVWMDYVVELHLSGRLLMTSATLEEFGQESRRASTYDRLLLTYYVEAMRSRSAEFSAAEQARIELLACFCERP